MRFRSRVRCSVIRFRRAKSILTSLKLAAKLFLPVKCAGIVQPSRHQHNDAGACRKASSQTFALLSFLNGALSLVPCWCLMCDHKYQREGLEKGKKCTLSGNTSSSLIVGSVWGRVKHSRSINKTRTTANCDTSRPRWVLCSILCVWSGWKILLNKRNVRSVENGSDGSAKVLRCDATHEPVTVPIKAPVIRRHLLVALFGRCDTRAKMPKVGY